MPTVPHDWEESVHGKVKELVPQDAPPPLGECMVAVIYHDENFHHDVMTGRLVAGILHVLSKTPVVWHSKK